MVWPFKKKTKAVAKSSLGSSEPTVTGRWVVVDPGLPLSMNSESISVFSTQPSIRKVVEFIARNASRIPLKVYKRNSTMDRENVDEGPLYELVKRPTKYHGGYRFWYDLICDMLVYDRFAAKLLPSADTPSGWTLYRVPAYQWLFTWSGFEDVNGINMTRNSDAPQTVSLDGFLWDKGYGGANGISPMKTLSQTLREYTESVKWRRKIWENGARVPGVWTMDAEHLEKLDDDDRHRLEGELNDYIAGGGKEGMSPILQGITWSSVNSFTPKDAQEVEGRTLTDIEVASAYHVPPEMVGARAATYGSMQQFRDSLYQEVLGPIFVQLEQAFNAQIVPLVSKTAGEYVEFDLNAGLRGSMLEQADVLQKLVGGPMLNTNEGRKELGFDNLGPEYDKVITQLNTVRGGGTQANPTDSGTQNEGESNDERENS